VEGSPRSTHNSNLYRGSPTTPLEPASRTNVAQTTHESIVSEQDTVSQGNHTNTENSAPTQNQQSGRKASSRTKLRHNRIRKHVLRYDLKIMVPPSDDTLPTLLDCVKRHIIKLKKRTPCFYPPRTAKNINTFRIYMALRHFRQHLPS